MLEIVARVFANSREISKLVPTVVFGEGDSQGALDLFKLLDDWSILRQYRSPGISLSGDEWPLGDKQRGSCTYRSVAAISTPLAFRRTVVDIRSTGTGPGQVTLDP